ncbi:type II secretion system F family protein [Actinoalloteichus caeruleus]|uniref:type II secretion system F family protein n=1 Tax=Actinoalloteichus cyanogriseus TaxID=2893586 RepID=UPI003BB991ED
MIGPMLLGAGLGLGLAMLVVWLFPPRPSLAALLHRSAPARPPSVSAEFSWVGTLGRPWIPLLSRVRIPGPQVDEDLAVLDIPRITHLAEKAALSVLGLLLPGLLSLLLALLDAPLPWAVPAAAGLAFGILGWVVPDLRVRRDAARRREEFRYALAAYLDLVWITLGGGAGVDSALHDCAAIGDGWAFTRLRRALARAHLTRTTPWDALRRLGEDLAVTDLVELAATVSLAGHEGARVRTSLAAKAQALRTRQLTTAEGQAQAATERMSLPVMALFLGFLVFIGYPALTHVLTGL